MATAEDTKRMLTAAEKRAARRARVLQGSESRLKLLKGQISSLKEPQEGLEQQLDEAVDELMTGDGETQTEASGAASTETTELKIPPRVDPAKRRRDAAVRRRKKEAMVQEMLGTAAVVESEGSSNSEEAEAVKELEKVQKPREIEAASSTAAFSRHSLALKLRVMEEKLVLLLIVGVAVYVALAMDLRAITASLAADDQLFMSYQDLISKGVSMDAIRQQFEREQLDPEVHKRLELLLTDRLKMEAMRASAVAMSSSGWLPDVADLGLYFSSLLAHPPIVLCVLLVRLVVATSAKGLHAALDLPDVKSPQEEDLGFLANLALSSRPVLKDFLVKARKSLDDVFVFIFALVVFVATRALWLS
ncbi:hypothetical protein BBP00_00008627 [Phytophthora kernoviae]|uniref:Transmembrane protein n=1 Tax=Phytophthora kernoviae TaxID=325452 RepID=A0A3F2RGG2_9STRA|nr:hypothetical protein BBP00_00008627 [Phytophthora kernoviae]